jgi:hypothetical protein
VHGLPASAAGGNPIAPGHPCDARKARLDDVLEDIKAKTLKYLYDFGDAS